MDLNQITIPSLDVVKASEFYKILGLRLIVDALPRYVRFECTKGNSTFSIHEVEELPKISGITLYFENENLDELVKGLQQNGIVFKQLPEDKPWLWREAHLNDLDGNHIILYHAGKNRKNPPWRID
ncbi:VOC family protein [Seonamhaeicola maritimus]|uniref:VOC family protein n=1 Tax=Seonamhaeicola maritimus TaxID=2591822 RepID=A0A5C7GDZ9_9FLAO|nr:VOC family protein [Seonamhaeicola maritimus]TXG35195.1 VOC family protein [Seonamhaeicola maritimus]